MTAHGAAGGGPVVVLCTTPEEQADAIARQLVGEGLCACVNVVPGVRSHYRWQGRVEAAVEALLVAKTTRAVAVRLRERIVALHPYEVPEVLELAVDAGLPAYLAWLVDSVAPRDGGA